MHGNWNWGHHWYLWYLYNHEHFRLLHLTLYFLFKFNMNVKYQGQNEIHSQNALLVLLVQQKQENGQQMFPQVYSPKSHSSLALVISVPTSVVFLIRLENYILWIKSVIIINQKSYIHYMAKVPWVESPCWYHH